MKLDELFEDAVVAQLDLPPARLFPPNTSIDAALEFLRGNRFSAVHVVDNDELIGIFTEVDYVRRVLHGEPADGTIASVMTRNPETVTRETPLSKAFEMMSRGNYRHLPEVDSAGVPKRLLKVQHLVQYLAEEYPEEILAMAPDVHQVTEADGG
jgi:CBS domain-containing protein